VVGEADSGAEALRLLKNLKPDIVLVDLSMPDMSGFDLIGQIQRGHEKPSVIVVSVHGRAEYIVKAFQAGAKGYVLKEAASEKILQAIQIVLAGEYFLDAAASQEVIKKLIQPVPTGPSLQNDRYVSLTGREQEIFVLLAKGFTNQQIAEKLFISQKTVKNHRANIMRKLELHSAHDLIRKAISLGLVDPEIWKA
jgi:DNA-binding NarL/FixJ family response regulator